MGIQSGRILGVKCVVYAKVGFRHEERRRLGLGLENRARDRYCEWKVGREGRSEREERKGNKGKWKNEIRRGRGREQRNVYKKFFLVGLELGLELG